MPPPLYSLYCCSHTLKPLNAYSLVEEKNLISGVNTESGDKVAVMYLEKTSIGKQNWKWEKKIVLKASESNLT